MRRTSRTAEPRYRDARQASGSNDEGQYPASLLAADRSSPAPGDVLRDLQVLTTTPLEETMDERVTSLVLGGAARNSWSRTWELSPA